MNRRHFLTGLGGSLGLLGLGGRSLADDASTPIRRLIILSNGHGNVHSGFEMSSAFGASSTPFAADLASVPIEQWSTILAPLQRHAQHLNVLDGLSLATCELDLPGYRHEKGWVHAWTGNNALLTGSRIFAQSASLDQLVAQQIARVDRLPSMELSIDFGRPVSHAGFQQELPLEESPLAALNRAFGGSTGAAGRSLALTFASAEYDQLMPRLGLADQERLVLHRDLLADLRGRLEGLANLSCAAPELGAIDSYDDHFDANADLVAACFACDVTRVATISLGDLPQESLPMQPSSGTVHDSWAHELYARDEAREGMIGYMSVHAAQMARLIDKLAAIPDPAGGTLLDHTVIAWGSEMADGWHGYERYCVVLAGGGWAWPQGRYLKWPYQTGPIEVVTPEGPAPCGVPHQHLLVSLAQAMGLETQAVGLSEVQTRQGEWVDLTGGLDLLGGGV